MSQPRFLNHATQNFPQNIEAEKAVLGSILIDPGAMSLVDEILPSKDDFFLPMNGVIYEAMQTLLALNIPPDIITLSNYLETNDLGDDTTGGVGYIAALAIIVPTSVHIEHYARIVRDHALMRRVIEIGGALTESPGSGKTVSDIIAETIPQLQELADRQTSVRYRHWSEYAQEYWDRLCDPELEEEHGLPTGYADLDKASGGLRRSDLYILGGRPSSGKTAFLLNIALRVAKMGAKPYLHSLEMTGRQMNQRLLTLESGIEHEKIRDGDLTEEERERLQQAVERSQDRPIYIDDSPSLTINEIRSRVRRENPDLLIIDYLGFIKSEGRKGGGNRVQEVDEITIGLKELAREMDIPVLVPSQLSRKVDERSDHTPLISDLRESGGIEQNADQIWLLYRELAYDPETLRPFVADLEVAKNRNGHKGKVHFFVKDDLMQFLDLTPAPAPPVIEQPPLVEQMPW